LTARLFYFDMMPQTAMDQPDLAALRGKIADLVADNAIAMVQCAIDAVKEEGQYQAMKYLFEMIGIFPAAAGREESKHDSLSQVLLKNLGLADESLPQDEAAR
jgi:hypothetical protein